MKLTVIGCGDAFGSGGRFNTCFLVETADLRFLIDCGATSLPAMKKLGVNPDSIDAVFLTHLHGDHYGGLAFLLLQATMEKTRDKPLTIAGPRGTEDAIRNAWAALFPGGGRVSFPFPVEFVDHLDKAAQTVRGVQVEALPADHGPLVDGEMKSYSLRLTADGKTIAYTGDTVFGDNVIAAGRGADLLIAEAYFFDRVVGKHTSHFQIAGSAALNGPEGPGQILLTHMSDEMLARRAEAAYPCAEDGMVVTV